MMQCQIHTPLGVCTIEGDSEGIRCISVSDHRGASVDREIPEELALCAQQLTEYFQGARTVFNLPLNPQGTDFQKKVWELLVEIPYGKTLSYLELSKKYGDTKAIRAIAAANGKNPLWVVVPCHRVIGSDGSLVGYAGGLWRKKWLLEHENPPAQQSLF